MAYEDRMNTQVQMGGTQPVTQVMVLQQPLQPQTQVNVKTVLAAPSPCTFGCACCIMSWLITFIVVGSIWFLSAILWDYKEANFLEIFYGIATLLSVIYLVLYCYFKLWIRWQFRVEYFCYMIWSLIGLWVVIGLIIVGAWSAKDDVDLTFGEGIFMLILFILFGPLFVACCWVCISGSGHSI